MVVKANNGEFFTNIEIIGNTVIERFIKDGIEQTREVQYQPTFFLKSPTKSKYRDIYGNFCIPKKFDSISDANNWKRRYKEEDVLGMDNFYIAYLSDRYLDDIEYDMSKIRVAIFDIEVTTDGEFPEPTEAKFPIDAITIYDTLDDIIYVFDLIEDVNHGIKKVKPWRPDNLDVEQSALDKVKYMPFTCSDKLLLAFVAYLRDKTPAILSGWNSERFDIPYIMNRLKNRFGEEFSKKISPYNEVWKRKSYDQFDNEYTSYSPKGFAHIDYQDAYKAFRFKTQPAYTLDYVSKEETGVGKVEYNGPIHTLRRGNYLPTIMPHVDENSDKMQKWLKIKFIINHFHEQRKFEPSLLDSLINFMRLEDAEEKPDKLLQILETLYVKELGSPVTHQDCEKLTELKELIFDMYSAVSHRKFISYAIYDVVTIKKMDNNLSYFELIFDIAYYAKMPIGNVMSKIQIWDSIIFNSLKKRNMVVPMKEIPEHNERIVGAFVKDPITGYYRYVISFDLTSLYPMLMLQGNISPEKLVGSFEVHPLADYINKIAPKPSEEYSCCPNGWMYLKDEMGIIPYEVLEVFKQRKSLKGEQLHAETNYEIIEKISMSRDESFLGDVEYYDIDVAKELSHQDLENIKRWSNDSIKKIEHKCKAVAKTKNTGQLNRKILINSAYGAMANKYFRYMDNRNASAITTFGQLVIQWSERKINEYLNKFLKTENVSYVFYIDTDSVYINVEKLVDTIGVSKFKETNQLVDFLDKFSNEKIKPMLDEAFEELAVYMNNKKSYMNMDREVIAMADINSEGLGAIWTGKKRYALNVYDNEGRRFAVPKLKIMGIETQRSSTPKIVGKGLEESIRVMLQEGIKPLQEQVENFRNQFLLNYRSMDYKELAGVVSANNIGKYSDEHLMPIKGCPANVKGVLAYNRLVRDKGLENPIREGTKVMWLKLKSSNPYQSDRIAWESGENIPFELRDILDYVDFMSVLNNHYFPALKRITDAGGFSYEYGNYGGFETFENTFF